MFRFEEEGSTMGCRWERFWASSKPEEPKPEIPNPEARTKLPEHRLLHDSEIYATGRVKGL